MKSVLFVFNAFSYFETVFFYLACFAYQCLEVHMKNLSLALVSMFLWPSLTLANQSVDAMVESKTIRGNLSAVHEGVEPTALMSASGTAMKWLDVDVFTYYLDGRKIIFINRLPETNDWNLMHSKLVKKEMCATLKFKEVSKTPQGEIPLLDLLAIDESSCR
jgi:hypothetical protein